MSVKPQTRKASDRDTIDGKGTVTVLFSETSNGLKLICNPTMLIIANCDAYIPFNNVVINSVIRVFFLTSYTRLHGAILFVSVICKIKDMRLHSFCHVLGGYGLIFFPLLLAYFAVLVFQVLIR